VLLGLSTYLAPKKQQIFRERISKHRQFPAIPMSEQSGNPAGYDCVLPGRADQNYCAIDTQFHLSYLQMTIVDFFEVVCVKSSNRFLGPCPTLLGIVSN
jgi:hypothetical protein